MASITNIMMLKVFTMPTIIRQTSIGIGTSKARVICRGGLGTDVLLPQNYSSLLFLGLWRFQNFYPYYLSLLIFFSILLMPFFKLPLAPLNCKKIVGKPCPSLTSYVTFETLETGKLTMDPPSTLTLTIWVP
jgi:hypothetical protein